MTTTSNNTPNIEYINPPSIHINPAYTQAIAFSAPAKTLIIGMQNAVDPHGNIVGKDDIAAQVQQTLSNIDACLEEAGAQKQNIILMRVYILDGQDIQAGLTPFQQWWGTDAKPPANTVLFVPRLHHPDLLVGIEGVAVLDF